VFACMKFLFLDCVLKCLLIMQLSFKGAGRVLIASDDLSIGGTALKIPESLIISEDLVFESDMVCVYNIS
jgi:hypothetical protein